MVLIDRGETQRLSVFPETSLAAQGAAQASSRPSLWLIDPQQGGFSNNEKKGNSTNYDFIPGCDLVEERI